MNMILKIGGSPLDVNFAIYKQSIKDIARLVIFSPNTASHLQGIQRKAKDINTYCLQLDTDLAAAIPELNTRINGIKLEPDFAEIADLESDLLKPGLSDTQKAALIAEIEEIKAEIRAELTKKLQTPFDEKATILSNRLFDISDIRIDVAAFLATEQATIQRYEADIAKREAEVAQLKKDYDAIVAAQDIIREKNIADMFQDLIPSGDELSSVLGAGSPEIAAIQLAVDVAKKSLGIISEGLKYSQLAEARTRCFNKQTELNAEIATLKNELHIIKQTENDILAVGAVTNKRDVVVTEIKKLVQSWTTFVNALNLITVANLSEASVMPLINEQKAYMGKVLTAYAK